jgi:hypothetical protein
MAGWWRRNAWGLVLLVPAMAAVSVAPYLQTYDTFLAHQERQPVLPGAEHWVSFSDARMRLVELSEESTLPTYDDRTTPAPAGLRVVRAVIEFDGVPENPGLQGCRLFLESTAGEQYSEKPTELTSVDTVSLPHGGCTPETDFSAPTASPSPGASSKPTPIPSGARGTWRTVCYFAMPLTAYPSGVRVSIATELPRYALLK